MPLVRGSGVVTTTRRSDLCRVNAPSTELQENEVRIDLVQRSSDSDQTSPSGRAIRNEQSAALYAALAQLPPQLRQIVGCESSRT